MDRIGLFQEMGYISIGDKYVTPGTSEYCLEQILHQITQEKALLWKEISNVQNYNQTNYVQCIIYV